MRYHVRNGDREHAASVTLRHDEQLVVEVDGVSYAVELGARGAGSSRTSLRVNGRCIHVESGPDGMRVDGVTVATVLRDEMERSGGSASASQDDVLESPMPGRILRVLTQSGAKVTRQTPLIVVEAMKMENQLFAPCEGEIAEVLVQTGDTVEAGAKLIKLTPSS